MEEKVKQVAVDINCEHYDAEPAVRVGTGFDVHRLVEGRRLILGGCEIPFEMGLEGHSDADVALHALMDALLGAAAMGDIGKYFPPDDPNYEGADSMKLLGEVVKLISDAGYIVGNCDLTIICQKPRLADYIDVMRGNIAQAASVTPSRVSVKATTTEKLGFTGRGEGIAAEAVCTLIAK
ncbi:MAG: 2-C-methyl-D-erythritol 2,4-cyclodiphosphate synthase [Eubacteriales bacterium]|nr:2-C-methyl-D-erythritol 2,4-cyclodiphosphate synthase [Eubacteriales bacterium]